MFIPDTDRHARPSLRVPQAQTPPSATPETPPPAAQAPGRPDRPDEAHADHAAGWRRADMAFVKKAAAGGMMEVAIAKLAQEKARRRRQGVRREAREGP